MTPAPNGESAEPAWREKQRVSNALRRLNSARRSVMALHGGNLDHPALDHIEAAMADVESVHSGRSES